MAVKNKLETKYVWLAITSVLVAIAVVEKITVIYRIFGKFDFPLFLTIVAVGFQIYSYYQTLATDASESLEERLRKEVEEVERRLRSEALDRVKRYEQSISGLDLRLSGREDNIERRVEYLEQALRQLIISQKIHEQASGHAVLSGKVDVLRDEVAQIKAALAIKKGD